ncbi:hypothetical protein M422DRAFT_26943 [Sphaerobolus stellatus SS14]|nr:hypothetical protein M422DRAFT_26943 [Sphaerobolus stellatus SS14]
MTEPQHPAIEAVTEDQDMDYEEEEGDYDEELYDDELFDDADEEAEAMVQQLGAALWADINQAYAQQGAQLNGTQEASATETGARAASEECADEETVLNAVQAVLDFADNHSAFQRVLTEIIVPGVEENTLYDALVEIAGAKALTADMAGTLSGLVEAVAAGGFFSNNAT